MTQSPVDNRPTHPLDAPFVVCGALMLAAMFCPIQFWLVRQIAAPPVNVRAVYLDGATDMCLAIARDAEIPEAQRGPVCAERVAGLE